MGETNVTYIKLDNQFVKSFVSEEVIKSFQSKVNVAHDQLHYKTGVGNEYLGWLNLPVTYDKEEFFNIQQTAEKIKEHSDILVVIGIGGSYLGARAAIEMLNHPFSHFLTNKNYPEIIFVGHHMSSNNIKKLLETLKDKDFSINVISKSGTTIEPAVTFRIFKQHLEAKYGNSESKQRIFVTTDKEKGTLKNLAKKENYQTFVVPDNIGGRYSVLSAVGLLPIAVSGISIVEIMQGANKALNELQPTSIDKNPAYHYAVLRHLLYKDKKILEILATYEPQLHFFQEWWKQLFGESEGKDGKGIFPTSAIFSTDLHSLGQYIQDGKRHLFQTILNIEKPMEDIIIQSEAKNEDDLNYLAGKSVSEINQTIFKAAVKAHHDGGIPNIILNIPKIDAFSFGYLVYFFEKACAMSGYLLEVNPFNQPGVEAYKQNMFKLLGKKQ